MKKSRKKYDAKFKAKVAIEAIKDVYSRFIVGWGLHNTLDASNCIEVLKDAIARWFNIHPKAEKYMDISSYCYTFNNPIRFIVSQIQSIEGTVPDTLFETLPVIQETNDYY